MELVMYHSEAFQILVNPMNIEEKKTLIEKATAYCQKQLENPDLTEWDRKYWEHRLKTVHTPIGIERAKQAEERAMVRKAIDEDPYLKAASTLAWQILLDSNPELKIYYQTEILEKNKQ